MGEKKKLENKNKTFSIKTTVSRTDKKKHSKTKTSSLKFFNPVAIPFGKHRHHHQNQPDGDGKSHLVSHSFIHLIFKMW